MSKGTSSFMISRSIRKVPTARAVNPSTSRILVILDPMTLPTTISLAPLSTDITDVVSSGNDVPKATNVTPITNGDIPSP